MIISRNALSFLCVLISILSPALSAKIELKKDQRIAFIGGSLGAGMDHYSFFETELYLRNPDKNLIIRNMCDDADTPGMRIRAGRKSPWAFPGAEKFQPEVANIKRNTNDGTLESDDAVLTRQKIDLIIGMFGHVESFEGKDGVENFKAELEGFIKHSLAQKYNGSSAPDIILVSPTAYQDLSAKYGNLNAAYRNADLAIYTQAIQEIAQKHSLPFIDLYTPSKTLFAKATKDYTVDGALLNQKGYKWLSTHLATELSGERDETAASHHDLVLEMVQEKNWCWLSDYKVLNGVHVFGRRFAPYGPKNYPFELKKTREMIVIRDSAIWESLKGKRKDLAAADAKTLKLPPVKTNYTFKKGHAKSGLDITKGDTYKPGPESQSDLTVAKGYEMKLFASEAEFPNLANPAQISFDNKGRLWVSVMPSYPHWRIGDPKPQDKLIIYEDTDGDGKADKETIFADDLHLPIGFEFTPEGVVVSQTGSLVLLKDTNGDDKYDEKEILLNGFSTHDTHHNISAFTNDPSGGIIMCEGIFLFSNVETSRGPVRGTNGGFYRYDPKRRELIRYVQAPLPNPWGFVFDKYGRGFGQVAADYLWAKPGMVKPQYNVAIKLPSIITSNKMRPGSGSEIISSRHFPEKDQGDLLITNTIGYLGAKQHRFVEKDTSISGEFVQNFFQSDDFNFRPVDLEFAPDGSLYVVDWHNLLIGHMQHSARDPLRDTKHGRIYRITYPSRPLVKPAEVAGASIDTLLDNLKLPEYRTRYRTRRELRGRDANEVLPKLTKWVAALDSKEADYERFKLEALWVSQGFDQTDEAILQDLLKAKDHKIRAAAVQTLRFSKPSTLDKVALMKAATKDDNALVRLEAIVSASWLPKMQGLDTLKDIQTTETAKDLKKTITYALSSLNKTGEAAGSDRVNVPKHIAKNKNVRKSFISGKEIFEKEGNCATCHQENGNGLPDVGFPPLAKSEWVTGDEERLIKITLHGLIGPITVKGKKYPGQVPMTSFKQLSNQEIADVLTYVRNSFGNKAPHLNHKQVAKVRQETKDQQSFYQAEQLLKEHPMEKK
ncbi:MAG: PVC-type heme-binding CxxCH protein [Akkermansiaceae bacterium]